MRIRFAVLYTISECLYLYNEFRHKYWLEFPDLISGKDLKIGAFNESTRFSKEDVWRL